MKKIIFALALIMCTITMSATTDTTYVREGTNFTKVQTVHQSTDIKTIYTYTIKDISYPIWITKNGRCYIIRTSRNENEYKQYLEESISREICKELNVEYKNSQNK